MNDDQLIERLARLKNIRPRDEAAARLKRNVFSAVHDSEPPTPADVSFEPRISTVMPFIARPIVIYPIAILGLLLIALTQGSALTSVIRHEYTEARLALASNDYDKARWSLNLAEQELADFQNSSTRSGEQIAYLARVSSQTDQYMNRLSLVGKPGQYSSTQCLEAYQAYEQYLNVLQVTAQHGLRTATNPSTAVNLSSLQEQAIQYQRAANTRLAQYQQNDL